MKKCLTSPMSHNVRSPVAGGTLEAAPTPCAPASLLHTTHMKALRDLFFCELANRLSSENQLVRGMPFVIEGATASTLKSLMLTHYHETERQVEKLTQVFLSFQQPARATKCEV